MTISVFKRGIPGEMAAVRGNLQLLWAVEKILSFLEKITCIIKLYYQDDDVRLGLGYKGIFCARDFAEN